MCDQEEISEHITRFVHRLQGGIKYAGSRSENQRDAYGKAEKVHKFIMEHIHQTEAMLVAGISEEDVLICKKVMCLMYRNLAEEEKAAKEETAKKKADK